MRVAGYIRNWPDASGKEPGFAQGERIRQWVADQGFELVVVCRDNATPRAADPVAGLRALNAVCHDQTVDLICIASTDILGQSESEVAAMTWKLRSLHELSTTDGKLAAEPAALDATLDAIDTLNQQLGG